MVICKITEVDVISNKNQMCFTLLKKGAVEAHTTVITDRHQCSYTLPD